MQAMKDSGIEWIGEIPEDWETVRLKYLLAGGNDGIKIGPFGSSLKLDDTVEDGLYKVYGQENLIRNDFNAGKRYIDENKYLELEVYSVFPGDILISMMGTIGKCSIVPKGIQNGIMDSHLTRIRVNEAKVYTNYISLLIADSHYIKSQLDLLSKGSIMNGLNSSIIKELIIACPPLTIQQRIANYLNKRCSEVDRIISAKQKQNELLKEQRQSIIYETVIKGLEKNIKYKDSGIDWFGEIPEDWETRKIKYIAHLKSGDSITSYLIQDEGDYPVYGGNGLRGYTNKINHDGKYILIGRQGALCGNVRLVEGEFWASEYAIVATQIESYDIVWLSLVLQIMNLNQYSASAAQPGISVDRIKNLIVPFPPTDIQQHIAEYLDKKCAEIDSIINSNNSIIEKLKEYRQSIIYEAVTGKIMV